LYNIINKLLKYYKSLELGVLPVCWLVNLDPKKAFVLARLFCLLPAVKRRDFVFLLKDYSVAEQLKFIRVLTTFPYLQKEKTAFELISQINDLLEVASFNYICQFNKCSPKEATRFIPLLKVFSNLSTAYKLARRLTVRQADSFIKMGINLHREGFGESALMFGGACCDITQQLVSSFIYLFSDLPEDLIGLFFRVPIFPMNVNALTILLSRFSLAEAHLFVCFISSLSLWNGYYLMSIINHLEVSLAHTLIKYCLSSPNIPSYECLETINVSSVDNGICLISLDENPKQPVCILGESGVYSYSALAKQCAGSRYREIEEGLVNRVVPREVEIIFLREEGLSEEGDLVVCFRVGRAVGKAIKIIKGLGEGMFEESRRATLYGSPATRQLFDWSGVRRVVGDSKW
jgi:hypothetical protein